MPKSTILEITPEEQALRLAALRRARDGYLLALHSLLWCADGRSPTEIAVVLFCSRSSVYRAVRAYRKGTLGLEHDDQGRLTPPVRTTVLVPTLRRSLLTLLQATPHAYGWCRTRWSCATLALTWQTTRGVTVSAETMRRWLHEVDWVWKRAKLVAKDDAPQPVGRLARIRYVCEQLTLGAARVCADALEMALLPKVGRAWMPNGTHGEVMTPGQNQQHDLAGALDLTTGTLFHCLGPRTTNALFRDLLTALDARYPAQPYARLDVVADLDTSHKANPVEEWLAAHPRVTLLWWPTYGPRANPIERAFGDVHDCCIRNHQRKRLPDLLTDVEDPLPWNGPWQYQLSELSDEPAVTAAVERMATAEQGKAAA